MVAYCRETTGSDIECWGRLSAEEKNFQKCVRDLSAQWDRANIKDFASLGPEREQHMGGPRPYMAFANCVSACVSVQFCKLTHSFQQGSFWPPN